MPEPRRLLDQVRDAIRVRHYSIRTEDAYVAWTKRFVLFHGKKHPSAMGAGEVNAFLTHLATEGNVSASTQAQALSALLFLYKHVLDDPFPWLHDIVRARRTRRLPAVLTRQEVRSLLGAMSGTPRLVASVLLAVRLPGRADLGRSAQRAAAASPSGRIGGAACREARRSRRRHRETRRLPYAQALVRHAPAGGWP